MRESDTASELDLALANALQLRPRASWTELAEPLGVTAGTLARRWDRLSAEGLAWVSATPGREFTHSRCAVHVLVKCVPVRKPSVLAALAECPEVATIEGTTGSADFLLDVFTADLGSFARFLADRIDPIEGVTSVTAMLATSLYVEGSRWRLQSLDPAQLRALGVSGDATGPSHDIALDDADHALLEHLVRDGRLGWADLAERTGISTATARRRVNRLVTSGIVGFRCHLAEALAGRPVQVSLLGNVSAADIELVARELATVAECRVAAAVTGPRNVFVTLWAHDLAEIQRLEAAITTRVPSLTVGDRIVGLHTAKRMGHLLDAVGRRVGVVPITPW